MTAATMARCVCCEDVRPVTEMYVPYGAVLRCRDAAACERRQTVAFDPTLLLRPDEEPVPAYPAAPPGAACAVCQAAGPPGGLYERLRGQWYCRDRGACEQRGVEVQYLHAWSDSSPDRLISAAQMRAAQAAAGTQIPPEPVAPEPVEMAARAAQEALGRKRQR